MPERGEQRETLGHLAFGGIRAPRISGREARAVREFCSSYGERLGAVADGAGTGHELLLVGSRRPGAERFLCDLPERGPVRCVGVFRADDAVNGSLDALLADYCERLGREEQPLCRPVRLSELVMGAKEVSAGEARREERREAKVARERTRAGLGLDAGVEGLVRRAG